MPGSKTVYHPLNPLISVTFTEDDHTYIDNRGDPGFRYKSATSFVKDLFPVFDADTHSRRIAEREGSTPEEVRYKWQTKADSSCRFGTRCHEIAEAVLTGRPMPHSPETDQERLAFKAFWDKAKSISSTCQIVGCEMLVFDPDLFIAGTVDLLCRKGTDFILLDWKTNETLGSDFKKYLNPPFGHIQDTPQEKYNFQLSLYEIIMRRNGYIIPFGASVKRFVLWYDRVSGGIIAVPCADRKTEVFNALLDDQIPPF